MRKILFFLGMMVLFSACSTDDFENILEPNEEQNTKVLKEISLLIGETLNNQDARSEIIRTVNLIDPYGNGVSFALLLGENENASDYEKRRLDVYSENDLFSKSSSVFKDHLKMVYEDNKEDYIELNKALEQNGIVLKSTGLNGLTGIESYLIENDLELYFPYKEKFDWEGLASYTVTFEDNDPDGNYIGFEYEGLNYEEISNIVDDYLYENPTAAIIPIERDYLGEELRITHNDKSYYLDPSLPFDVISNFYDDLYVGGNNGFNPGGNSNPGGDNNSGEPSPQRVRLTHNVNPYTFFNENHILTNFIPKARITNKKWKRLFSKAHRTRIARAGSTIGVNPDGSFSAMKNTFYFDFDISASDLRNKRWKDVGIMFDPNWHKTKGSQQIIVWTKRRNASVSEVEVKTDLKIDAEGNFTPSTSISHKITSSSKVNAIFRGNVELDRDQVLTTVVNGSEYDEETYEHNNVNLSVRRVATHFEFFFDLYYTNL